MTKVNKGNVLIMCAHSDDQVLGVGGLTAKLAKEGYNVYTFIFSYGEMSHPHMKSEVIIKTRVEESKSADAILGGAGVFFLGLMENKMTEEFKQKNMSLKIENIFLKYKPRKILTHSKDDFHPAHRFVYNKILNIYDKMNKKVRFNADVYSFDVWNIWNIKKRQDPELVVDITPFFRAKINALHAFKSQINVFSYAYLNNLLYLGVYIKAVINGLRHGYKLAEVFYKVR